jgi:hypothetical protein
MKNMKNYEAPKAEVIELNVNKDFMLGSSTTPGSMTSVSNTWS